MKVLLILFSLCCAFTLLGAPLAPVWAEEEGPSPTAKKEKPEEGEKKEGKKTEAGGEGEGEKKEKKPTDITGGRFAGDPIFIHIAPMVLPVISENGVEQLVVLQVDIQVKDIDAADNIHSNMPRVRDALMRALYGGLGQGSLRNGRLVDVVKIKAKARAAVEDAIGAEGIRDVLVQAISQRML